MKKLRVNCAEALVTQTVFNKKKAVSKKRLGKDYRNKRLDETIRKQRTRRESKILLALSNTINVPKVFFVDESETKIVMEFIDGVQLKKIIEKKPFFCKTVGEQIKKIHGAGIIHGDLTTSNIIVSKKPELFFIDFGLSFYSKKIEDVATDLIVFKKTFNSTHSSIKNGWEKVLSGYNPNQELVVRMEKIEKRARYH